MLRNKARIGLLLAMLLAVGGCSGQVAQVPPKQEEGKVVPVQIDTVKRGSVGTRAGVTGKLAPSEEVAVTPKISGKINQIQVKLGQKVQAGAVLFTLDQSDLNRAVKQAQAAYELSVASLRQSASNTGESLQQARSGLVSSEQRLQDARRDFERISQLYGQGAVAAQQLEQAKAALVNAQTTYDNAKQTLATAQQKTGVAVTEASVEQARVALENAREELGYAVITAPISGTISQVHGSAGEMASVQSAVVTIVNTDPLIAKANLSEQDVSTVKKGDVVTITLTTLEKDLKGTITAISPVMNQDLRAYPVEISLANPEAILKADMVVNIQFGLQQSANALVVSRKAVFEENGKQYVYRITDKTAKKVEVKTGEQTSDSIELVEGVQEGDRIVVRGQTLLRDGATVQIQQGS
ncbi:efflux RND transporter periplasmic adaptor subunit [Brevibacillus choshinensis]|uniref:Efflux RND transporter periplasmic adaptor subunit n=1 Tax=Brevibacillus choshinensis TaxID=54911 RepID=A0ABX7FKJ3_BRECH|nr:efflux RND transporter periplasmic adaptor subunit [Brevibacillus choshinensis]QRG66164.1 efflux RND transporter periplasmic adaptor subunit [Brevibacillus choshinensis]